ncbi:PH domain-containing protein [Pseudonocardia sp. TRM90224]|uniref:PH domain-containing protein n=1 Tax=Pseudonocardia sp. TRM90224 TaxID=2812678 RepID=UPI001E2E0B98|nr:PH domain-containing protein [Pseudonocardia sp. TRM90224]
MTGASPADTAVQGTVAQPEWQQLDRRSIWVAPVQPLAGLLLAGLVAITFRGWDRFGVIEPAIGAAVAIGVFALSAWHWRTTRYRITPTHVEMTSGMLVRKHRSVARDRLRSVDLTSDVVHRLAGLSVVAIGTGRQGGESDDELKLDSVTTEEAERLRRLLLDRGSRAPAVAVADPGGPAEPAPLARFEASWVKLAPLSIMGLVALAVLAGGAAQLARSVGGDEIWRSGPVRGAWDWVVATPILTVVIGGLVGLLVLNAVLSTVLYVLFYGGYTLVRADDGTLRISYGLLTQRSVSIEERRIRGVRMDEPLMLQLGRGARLRVVAAGLGTKDGEGKEKKDSDMLLPTAPAAVAHRVTADVLGTPTSPVGAPMRRHPVAALRILLLQGVSLALVPAAVLLMLALVGLVPHWIWQVLLLLVVPAVVGAWLEYRNLGHARVGEFLVAQGGPAGRHTVAVRTDGIIAWQFRRTVFQRRPRVLTAIAAVAAGKGTQTIKYALQDDVLPVARDCVPGLLDPFLEPDHP